jgi:hypothetical protein
MEGRPRQANGYVSICLPGPLDAAPGEHFRRGDVDPEARTAGLRRSVAKPH